MIYSDCSVRYPLYSAGLAHLVERHLAKVEVASSSLVTRSILSEKPYGQIHRACCFEILECKASYENICKIKCGLKGMNRNEKRCLFNFLGDRWQWQNDATAFAGTTIVKYGAALL